jgi:hypothetical protein
MEQCVQQFPGAAAGDMACREEFVQCVEYSAVIVPV